MGKDPRDGCYDNFGSHERIQVWAQTFKCPIDISEFCVCVGGGGKCSEKLHFILANNKDILVVAMHCH